MTVDQTLNIANENKRASHSAELLDCLKPGNPLLQVLKLEGMRKRITTDGDKS